MNEQLPTLYSTKELRAKISSNDYGAELCLQHAMSNIDALEMRLDAEQALRLTLQHHAADLAQTIAHLEARVKRLAPTADDVRYTAEQDWTGLPGSTAFLLIERHADGWAGIGDMMEAWRDAEVRRVTADLEAERDQLRAQLAEIEAQAVPTGERQAVLLTDAELLTCRRYSGAAGSASYGLDRAASFRAVEAAVLAANGLEVRRG